MNNNKINEKIKNNINSIISKKVENNNKIELNKKENIINNKEKNENQNKINIIDNAYKTFYKKNKFKDIYSIKLNLRDNFSDSNNIMNNNFNYHNKYNVINEEEEFTQNEKIKISQISFLRKSMVMMKKVP